MLVEQIRHWGKAALGAPASADAVLSCEAQLGYKLPDQLRQLLAETNGIEGEYGLGMLWPAHRIAEDNAYFRNNSDFRRLYMPFAGLIFSADAGNGDQFGISLTGNHDIYVWNHVDDSRVWVAPTVMRYLEDWMNGTLKV